MKEIEIKTRTPRSKTEATSKSVIDFETDSKPEPSPSELSKIADLCRLQIALEDSLKSTEETLRELKEKLRKVAEEAIPTAMEEVGQLKELTLKSGEKLKIDTEIYASVSKENQNQAYEWLSTNNYDDIVKNSVIIPFDKGENERSAVLIDLINFATRMAFYAERGEEWSKKDVESLLALIPKLGSGALAAEKVSKIHPQTLKAFVKERLLIEANSKEPDKIPVLPQKLFGVYTVNKSKIIRPKKKK